VSSWFFCDAFAILVQLALLVMQFWWNGPCKEHQRSQIITIGICFVRIPFSLLRGCANAVCDGMTAAQDLRTFVVACLASLVTTSGTSLRYVSTAAWPWVPWRTLIATSLSSFFAQKHCY
jgi:hypothetical protein